MTTFKLYSLLSFIFFVLTISSFGGTDRDPWADVPDALTHLLSPLSERRVDELVELLHSRGLSALKEESAFCKEAGVVCGAKASTLSFDGCLKEGGRRRKLLKSGILTCQERFGSLASRVLESFFIRRTDITPGNTLRLFSGQLGPQLKAPRSFLPDRLSKLIPFSTHSLPQVLQALDIVPDSDMATAMATNIQRCELPDERGLGSSERSCVKSIEQLAYFISSHIGHHNKVGVHSFFSDPSVVEKPLEVLDTRLLLPEGVEKFSCHMMAYPYQVFYCHALTRSEVHVLTARTPNGELVSGLGASCHLDTSKFSPNHTALHAFNMKPGEGEICHILIKTLVFVKENSI